MWGFLGAPAASKVQPLPHSALPTAAHHAGSPPTRLPGLGCPLSMKACWVEGPWCPRARGWPLPREGPAPYPGQALPLLEAQASPSASPSRGRSQAKDPQAPLSPVYSLLPESSPTPRARATKWVLPARKGAPLARAPRRAGAKEPETHARPLSVPVLLPPLAVRASPWAVLGVRGLPRGAGVPGASLSGGRAAAGPSASVSGGPRLGLGSHLRLGSRNEHAQ